MAVRFQLRRDTAANWASANSVLALGEPGVETDTLKVKVGDGSTAWNSLAYSITKDFTDLVSKPTTVAGYGIVDALTLTALSVTQNAASGTGALTYNNTTGVFEYTPPNFEGLTGDFTGSVFADDSTLLVDGVNATLNLANNNITDLSDADQTVQSTDDVTFNSVTGNVITSQIDSADSSAIEIQTDVDMLAGLTVGNHIVPSSSENIDLGSASARFRDLYLSGNSAVIGDLALKRHTSGGLLVSDHSTGNPTNVTTHNITANDITAAGDVDVTGNLTMTGYIAGPATMTIDPAAVGDNTGTLVVAGNLQVDGTTTTINSQTLEVEDKNVVLGPNAANDAANNGAGLTVTQPDTTDATLIYDTTSTQWELNKDLDVTGDITVSGTVDGRDLAADGTVIDGLGTASTSATTDFVAVTGDDMTGALSINSGTDNTALSLESTDSAVWLTMTDPTASLFFGNTGGEFALWTGGTESFRVDDNGNVGIGYNNPSNNIHILGSDASPNVGITLQSDDTANATATLTLMARDASNVNQTVNIQNTLGRLNIDANMDVIGVGTNFKSASYNILNLQTDTDDNGSSDDGIFKITNGSAGTTKAEFRWDESEDLVHVSYGDHGRHISINSSGNVGIGTSSTDPDLTLHVDGANGYPANSGTTPVGHIAIRAKSNSSSHGAYIGVADASPWGTWIQPQDANNLGTNYPLLLNPNGGSIGIGTTSPSNILHIKNGVAGGPQLELESTSGTANSAFINFDGSNLQLSTSRDMVDGSWRDTGKSWGGINIQGPAAGSQITFATADGANTAPSTRLTIDKDGDATFSQNLRMGSRNALSPTTFGYSASWKALILGSAGTDYQTDAVTISMGYNPSGNSSGSYTGTGGEILFRNNARFLQPNSTDDGYLNTFSMNNGDVGIGETDPSAKLHISKDSGNAEVEALRLSNGDDTFTNSETEQAVALSFDLPAYEDGTRDSRLAAKIVARKGGAGTNDWYTTGASTNFNGQLDFYTRQDDVLTKQMTLNEAGKVGIGTDSPSVTGKGIQIYNEGNDTTGSLRLSGNNNTGTPGQKTNSEIQHSGSSGQFKILHYGFTDSPGTERFRIDATGDSYTNDGTISSLSDIRVKKEVVDLADGLDTVNQLRPVTFKYNGLASMAPDDGTINYGFIADEVQAVAPQYVKEHTDEIDGEKVTDFKTLSTGRMVPMLFKAVQELSAQVEALQAEINELRG